MSRTKIVILQMKEIIYTAIFVGLGILLLILLFVMFWPGKGDKKEDSASVANHVENEYEAGVYTKEIKIGDAVVNVELALDKENVKSVELVNLDKSVATMYPLMKPTVEKISKQLAAGKKMDEIVVSQDSQYTEKVIIDSVNEMIKEHVK